MANALEKVRYYGRFLKKQLKLLAVAKAPDPVLQYERPKIYQLKRVRHLTKWYGLFVIIPSFLYFLWMVCVEERLYEVETHLMVSSPKQQVAQNLSLDALISGVSDSRSLYAAVALDMLDSFAFIQTVDKRAKIKEMFQSKHFNWLNRLSKNATLLETQRFYRKYVLGSIERESALIKLKILLPSSELALRFSKVITAELESALNKLSEHETQQLLNMSRKQFEESYRLLKEAQDRYAKLNAQNKELDVKEHVKSSYGIKQTLEAELSKAKIMLSELSKYMQESSVQVKQIKNKIAALKEQIKTERQRLIGTDQGKLSVYQKIANAKIDLEFFEKLFIIKKSIYIEAESQQVKQRHFLLQVIKPVAPDDYIYPRVWLAWLKCMFILSALFVVMRISVMFVKEHLE